MAGQNEHKTDDTDCPAWCMRHEDGLHVGTDVITRRYSVPIESWDEMSPKWRRLFNDREYVACLLREGQAGS